MIVPIFRFVLPVCLLALLTDTVVAQDTAQGVLPNQTRGEEIWRVQHFTTADGLPIANVTTLLEDQLGFLWVGTDDGLSRFDGYQFTSFRPRKGDTTSIGTTSIRALYEDSMGYIWTGGSFTDPRGASRYNPSTDRFTNYRHDGENPNSLIHDGVSMIFSSRKNPNIVWISSRNDNLDLNSGGLSRFDLSRGTFYHYRLNESDSRTRSFALQTILEDREGTLWGGGWGINRFEPTELNGLHSSDSLFTSYLPSDKQLITPENFIDVLYEPARDNGVLWAGSRRGLHRFDKTTNQFTSFFLDPENVRPNTINSITAIHEDRQGKLWIGTWTGLYTFDSKTGQFSRFEHQPNLPYVSSILEDRNGVLWIGNQGGLMKLERRANPFNIYRPNPAQPEQNRIFGLYEDHEGSLWIARSTMLTRFNRNTGAFNHYHELASHAIYEDRSGRFWAASCQEGLRSFEPDFPDRFIQFPSENVEKIENYFCPNRPLEDQVGRFWLPTYTSGLLLLDRDTNAFIQYMHDAEDSTSLGSDRLLHIYEAPSNPGILWLGSEAGLSKFDPVSERFTNYMFDEFRRTIMMYEDDQERFWVITARNGLHLFDRNTGSINRTYTTEDGLASNFVYAILPDNLGYLWLSTDHGLSRFDPNTESFQSFFERDGLPGNQFSEHAYFRSSSGELFFGGPNGLMSFFPDQVTSNPSPPEVVLTDFRLAGLRIAPNPDGPLKASISHSENIVLPYNSNDIGFDFVALHSIDPARNRYRYRLEGYDSDWIDVDDQRTARYPRLEPGEYTFQVIAASSDGVWNEEGVSINISIRPPWWRTRSMFLVYGFLFMVGIYGIDRVQRRRLLRAAREKARERELAHAEEIRQAHTELQQAHESLKSTQQQLIQQEKMASLGQLTSGIAHEIKNPLNFVNNFAELNTELLNELESNPDSRIGDVLETIHAAKINAQQIAKHGKRADRIVQSMMEHAGGKGERYEVAINPLVEEFTNLTYSSLQARIPDLEVEIEKELDEQVGSLVIAPQEIGRVLQNILGNAFEAVHDKSTRAGGDYVPRVHITTVYRENTVEIRISDNGAGIPQQALDRVFEPFFTTKPTGSGTGLGLSLSYDIVTQGTRRGVWR